MSPDEYRYSSFTGEDCIRLLELQPGQHLDPITCQLQEVRLDDCTGRYAALSYVWGPPEGAMRIRVNDGSLVIRSNLHCALRNLRHADRPRTLWVDAVCINQSDISERNAQVPMMGEVYRNAACTICFLGPKRKTTRALYAMLEDLAQEARTLHAEGSIYHDMDTLPAFVRHVTINPVKSELFHKYAGDFSIMDMAACEWWHRAWTVQEILLSPNVAIHEWEIHGQVGHGLSGCRPWDQPPDLVAYFVWLHHGPLHSTLFVHASPDEPEIS